MKRPSKAADRRALVARGYDPAKLAQYERDAKAGVFSDVVRDMIAIATDRATVAQLDEQIKNTVALGHIAPRTHVDFYSKLVGALHVARNAKAGR